MKPKLQKPKPKLTVFKNQNLNKTKTIPFSRTETSTKPNPFRFQKPKPQRNRNQYCNGFAALLSTKFNDGQKVSNSRGESQILDGFYIPIDFEY